MKRAPTFWEEKPPEGQRPLTPTDVGCDWCTHRVRSRCFWLDLKNYLENLNRAGETDPQSAVLPQRPDEGPMTFNPFWWYNLMVKCPLIFFFLSSLVCKAPSYSELCVFPTLIRRRCLKHSFSEFNLYMNKMRLLALSYLCVVRNPMSIWFDNWKIQCGVYRQSISTWRSLRQRALLIGSCSDGCVKYFHFHILLELLVYSLR